MYFTTEKFKRTLKESHTAISRIDAITTGQDVAATLTTMAGTLTQDYDDATRWSLDATLVDPDNRDLGTLQSLLNPLRTVYKAYRGVRYLDGTEESVPCGTYYPTEVKFKEVNGAPTIILKGFDASTRCQDDLATPIYLASGTPVTEAVPAILRAKLPSMQFSIGSMQWTTPTLIMRENIDPWQTSMKLMSSGGNDLHMNRLDVCVSDTRKLTVDPVAVWDFIEGANADFWEPEVSSGNDAYPNVIVVVGDNPAAPNVWGTAWDNDPKSDTYRYGPYGEHVRTIHSEFLTSSEQAYQMAAYWLSKLLGPQNEVTFSAIPNPALDVGDTVTVTRARLGLNMTKMLVSHIELPLDPGGAMTVTCRRSIITDMQGNPVQ